MEIVKASNQLKSTHKTMDLFRNIIPRLIMILMMT